MFHQINFFLVLKNFFVTNLFCQQVLLNLKNQKIKFFLISKKKTCTRISKTLHTNILRHLRLSFNPISKFFHLKVHFIVSYHFFNLFFITIYFISTRQKFSDFLTLWARNINWRKVCSTWVKHSQQHITERVCVVDLLKLFRLSWPRR